MAIIDARRAYSKSVPITVYVQIFLRYVNIPTNHIWKSYSNKSYSDKS